MPASARDLLSRVFGYDRFRGQQEAIIEHTIAGGDSLVLMPTGGGKSLCYQIPALVRPGAAVVVSPLIALMRDQVDTLLQAGVSAACLNSTLAYQEALDVEARLRAGRIDLLYVAPERLLGERTLALLNEIDLALSRSTRRTACRSGVTTSARSTSSSRRCTSGSRPSAHRPHRDGRRADAGARSGSDWTCTPPACS